MDLNAELRAKDALYRVTSAIIEHMDVADLLQTVVDTVASALPAERVVLITFNLAERRVERMYKGGSGIDAVVNVPFEELLDGLSGWVLREQAPALSLKSTPDPRESPEVQLRRAQTECGDIIVVPLRYRDTLLGTMTAINHVAGAPFSQQHVDMMMAMASHSAMAITTAAHQARLEQEIEERKELEISLAQARDEALEASRHKSAFLANMSHEIRTPMNAILGMLHLLQSTDLTVRQQDYASKSEGAAKSLLGLLNDILDFSKVEAGKMTLESEPMRLDLLLRNLSVVLAANVKAKDIEVLFDVDPTLPEVVMGDALRLQQILVNLAGNAVKFTERGQVVLSLRHRGGSQGHVRIEFAVKDTGIGIAPEQQGFIFTGFSQAEGSTTRRFGGTGLGLAISKRFVELMGSGIQIDSAVGFGSTFSFVLDMPVVQDVPQALQKPQRSQVPKQRVLVVDDSEIAGGLIARMVASWGWEVDLALSGEEALATVLQQTRLPGAAFPYQVVYMDWHMPGMDGWEATKRLRALATERGTAQPCIILVTSNGREALAQRSEAEQNMLSGFLVKPATASMLLDAFMEASNGNSGVRQAAQGRRSRRQLQGMRILVVEDNLVNQQVAEELLIAEGALVSLAANGQQGVHAVAAAAPQFDVVLMDLQMPVLDGYDATRLIREELGLKTLPIIAMTANAMTSDRDACIAAGMTEHIGKPFDMAKLVSQLIRTTGIGVDASANGEATALMEASTVPDIPGLDLAAALARMSGMRSLYARTARDFSVILDSAVGEIGEHVAADRQKAAVMLLHTLKGNAGTLGATALARACGELEADCKAQWPVSRLPPRLQALQRLVSDAQGLLTIAIAAVSETTPQPAPVANTAHTTTNQIAALRELAQLARSSDLQVLQRHTELREVLQSLPPALQDGLELALQGLDLGAAATLCNNYLASQVPAN